MRNATVSNRCSGGFTLTELLLAIGILAVGLSMSAALFPAAIRQTRGSMDDLLGMHICQNGLVIARTRLSPPLKMTDGQDLSTYYADVSHLIPEADRQYPAGSGSRKGFLVLARRRDGSSNDYDLAIVSYMKSNAANTVTAAYIKAAIEDSGEGSGSRLTVEGSTYLDKVRVGTPLISCYGGAEARFARVIGRDSEAGLDCFLLDRQVEPLINKWFIVITEQSGGTITDESPGMNVLFARTPLAGQ